MEKILENKVIVISGGTKGIGKGIVLEAVRAGAKVVFGGRDEKAAKVILDEVCKEKGEAVFVQTDLTHIEDCKKLFEECYNIYGAIDGFVNYAGLTYISPITDCDEETFDAIFDVNIKAAFFCLQQAVSYMREKGGSIVLFGSPHDEMGEQDRTAYTCSKAALSVLSTHLSKFYAKYNIRTNYITMGWTPTEGELALREKQGMSEKNLREYASGIIPVGRMQEVQDHVPAVMFLLSDYSKMVNGSNIRITGGLYF